MSVPVAQHDSLVKSDFDPSFIKNVTVYLHLQVFFLFYECIYLDTKLVTYSKNLETDLFFTGCSFFTRGSCKPFK